MRSRIGLTIAVIAVLVGLAVAIFGVISVRQPPATEETIELPEAEPPAPGETISELQDLTIEGGEVTKKDADGNIIWRLVTAGKFDHDRQTQTMQAENIQFELMRPGHQPLIVEAPKLLANYPQRTIRFSQGVRAYTADNSQSFEMPELIYQTDTGKLIAEGEVRFRYGGYEATARRLVIDSRAEEVRMSGSVRARLSDGQSIN